MVGAEGLEDFQVTATIKSILENELQILGCRKVTVKEFPKSAKWGHRFTAYTPPSKREGVFIFLGSHGAVREGSSPTNSHANEMLKTKLLDRARVRQQNVKPPPNIKEMTPAEILKALEK